MTIMTESSLNDINSQNEMILQIQSLYFLRLADINFIKRQRGCFKKSGHSLDEIQEESKLLQASSSLASIREESMQDIIAKNQGTIDDEMIMISDTWKGNFA